MIIETEDRCPRCGGTCVVEEARWSCWRHCMVCGSWSEEEFPPNGDSSFAKGGGFGVYACRGKGNVATWCGVLKEWVDEPFAARELEGLDFAWFSRPLANGRWEGVLLKGESPGARWPVGLIPLYDSQDPEDKF
jgi:hypothetical protein